MQTIRCSFKGTVSFILFAILLAHDARGEVRPNVILMMADDLGYNDLSCYGSKRIKTPHLDQLASEGIRLTSFYAGSTVCTPSRMALLTGSYPRRCGWRGGVIGYRIDWKSGLASEARTMAEVFKSSGYVTGMCGKWHLGDGKGMQPFDQGFDSAFYIKSSNNQTTKLWHDKELVADPFDNRRLTEQFTQQAIKFITSNRKKPFFLYLPFTAPHFPAEAHPDWKGKSANHAYGDVVEELDSRVGDILAALEKEKLDRKTIVVFLSDNGPEKGQRKWASSKPYRGLKWSSLEGGNRVPCIVRWPDVIPGSRQNDKIISAIDWLPTLAHACDIELDRTKSAQPELDGLNVWNTLVKRKNSVHPRDHLLFWNGWAQLEAIRVGSWKLYFQPVKEIDGSDIGPVLIDLSRDPAETMNLAAEFPDKVASMKRLAESLAEDVESNSIPLGGIQNKGK